MLSALPYLGCWLLSMGGGQLADYLRETCLFRTVSVRKAFTIVGEDHHHGKMFVCEGGVLLCSASAPEEEANSETAVSWNI